MKLTYLATNVNGLTDKFAVFVISKDEKKNIPQVPLDSVHFYIKIIYVTECQQIFHAFKI